MVLAVIAALSASPAAQAQRAGYKLIIMTTSGGITAIDYPSSTACEKARKAVEEEQAKRVEKVKKNTAPDAVISDYGVMPQAFCISG